MSECHVSLRLAVGDGRGKGWEEGGCMIIGIGIGKFVIGGEKERGRRTREVIDGSSTRIRPRGEARGGYGNSCSYREFRVRS